MSSEQHLYVGVPSDAPLDKASARRAYRIRHDDVPIPWQPVLTAFFLLAIGIVFWPMGIYFIFSDYDRGVSFITIGVVTFIPGSYAVFHLVQTWRGVPGFKYKNMPGKFQD